MVSPGVKTPNNKRKSFSAGGNAQSPKLQKVEGGAKTPKAEGAKTPKQGGNNTPFKGKFNKSPKGTPKAQKSPNPNNSPASLKKFKGTGDLNKDKKGKKSSEDKKSVYLTLREKVTSGDATVITQLEQKIQAFKGRTNLTKTGKRKLRLLQKMRSVLTGEAPQVEKSSQKRKEKKGGKKQKGIKKEGAGAAAVKQEAAEDDSEGSADQEGSEEEQGRRINVLYTQGSKKQNEGKKDVVKAKNLKLHAMRKQGQLAGSKKENQKRSARRGQKNANKTNGDS